MQIDIILKFELVIMKNKCFLIGYFGVLNKEIKVKEFLMNLPRFFIILL